jgi:hypothetical protein
VEELEKEEKAALVLVLLKQLQPFLSDINLSVSKTSHPQAQNLNKFLNNVNIQRQFGGSQIKEDKEFDTQVDESESSSQRDKATLEDSPGASFLPRIFLLFYFYLLQQFKVESQKMKAKEKEK